MHHRPVTRSQTLAARRRGGEKRDAPRETTPPEPRRKQQRRIRKQDVVQAEPLENGRQADVEDGVVLLTEDQQKLEVQLDVGYEVLLWGDGTMEQLGPIRGPGGDPEVPLPKLLPLTKTVRQVAAGGMHTLLLMTDGTLQSFGSNDEGALGRKTVGHVWEIEAAEDASMQQSIPTEVALPDRIGTIEGIECTDCGSFLWTADGSVYGWGSFRSSGGSIGFSPAVGIQKTPSCIYQPGISHKAVVKLATGGNHVLALLKDGSVFSWGDGERGQLGRRCVTDDVEDTSAMLSPAAIPVFEGVPVADVFAGESVSFFIARSREVFACGLNASGQLGIPPSTEPALEACPTIESSVARQELFLEPTLVPALSTLGCKIKQLGSGKRHTMVLSDDGAVYSFGASVYGSLGRPNDEERPDDLCPSPEKISGLDGHHITQIAAGQDCSACLDEEGRLLTFGGEHSGLTCVGSDGDDLLVPCLLTRGKATKILSFHGIALGGHHGILLGRKRN